MKHATFGLGDSSYPKFNYAAKRLHRRLAQLGSTPLLPLGLGDDQDALGVDQALSPWLESLWEQIRLILPPSPHPPLSDSDPLPPRYLLRQTTQPDGPSFDPLRFSHLGENHSSVNSRLVRRRPLSEGDRVVLHLALRCEGEGLPYAPGDALAVQPRNPPEETRSLLLSLGLDPHERVELKPSAAHAPPLPAVGWSAFELFSYQLDVFSVPRRSFFAKLAHFASSPLQRERLEELGRVEGAPGMEEYSSRPRRTCAEVLLDFSSARPPLQYYLDLIPPLRPRYFSIASAPQLSPQQIELCVAVVRYQTMIHKPRFGVCSTYLASLRPQEDEARRTDDDDPGDGPVRVWLRKGCLSLPSDRTAPLIMVGPGTGVAPFRSFLQARKALVATGASVGEAVLFFGCRKREEDYLYSSEWKAHLDDGSLQELHVAFSREQEHKVYVQHLIAAQGARVWQLLTANAHVYIAGASNQMPKAVRKAIRQVTIQYGSLDESSADAFLKELEARGRLQCETW
ncbi:MAG: hypothetical protein SGPRY_008906 [Prymnesium sp.]